MATTIGFRVRVGDLEIISGEHRPPAQLLRLRSELTMDGVGGGARLSILFGAAQWPSLGQPLEVDLDSGDGAQPVFRGKIRALRGDASTLYVEGSDGLGELARREFVGTFADSDAGTIARAILDDGEILAGTLTAGPSFPRYLLHPGPSALAHLQTLARRCGLDLFTDRRGAVSMTSSAVAGATRTLQESTPLLQIRLERATSPADSITLHGEGAASTRGAARSHWLVRDLAPIRGEAKLVAGGDVQRGSGARPRTIVDGALRSGQVAATLAEARARALTSRQLHGTLTLLGEPTLTPGDLLVIERLDRRLPAIAAAIGDADLRIRTVVHHLDTARGYCTEVEL